MEPKDSYYCNCRASGLRKVTRNAVECSCGADRELGAPRVDSGKKNVKQTVFVDGILAHKWKTRNRERRTSFTNYDYDTSRS